jgi:hypothetical protein
MIIPKLHLIPVVNDLIKKAEYILIDKHNIAATDMHIIIKIPISSIFDIDIQKKITERIMLHFTQWELIYKLSKNIEKIDYEDGFIILNLLNGSQLLLSIKKEIQPNAETKNKGFVWFDYENLFNFEFTNKSTIMIQSKFINKFYKCFGNEKIKLKFGKNKLLIKPVSDFETIDFQVLIMQTR